MKTPRILRHSIATLLCLASTAHAATLTWDITPGTVGAGDSAITGGAGTWDTANGNWTSDGGANNIAWTNGDSAIFQDTGGVLTLGAAITADDLTFSTAGYSIVSGTLTLAGTPTITTAADASISSVIAGTDGFTKLGAAQLTLNGSSSNTFTGTTVVDNGTLVLGKTGGAFAIIGNVQMGGTIGNEPNLRMAANEQFGSGVVMTFVNPAGSYPRFDLQGTTQTLAGVSDATGAGVIQNEKFNGGGTAAAGTLTLNGAGSYAYDGYVRDEDDSGHTYKLNLIKSGAGTQTLAGNNVTYTGTTTVNAGQLELLNATAFASAATVNTGGTLRISNSNGSSPYSPLGGTAAIVVNAGGVLELNNATTGYGNRKTLAAAVSGAGTINVIGTGYLALNSVNNITLSGQINVQSGGLGNDSGASANAFGTCTADLDVSIGAFFDLRGGAPQFDALTGAGEVINSFTANTLTLGVANGTGIFTGTMKDGGNAVTGSGSSQILGLTKTGGGTQTLSGNGISYTGLTTVNQGTLVLSDARLVNGVKTVAGGATLEINSAISFASRWNNSGTISGDGLIIKTGSGVFGTTGAVNFSGTIDLLDGRLHNDNVTGNWTGSTADVNIGASGVLDLRANDIYVDELNGTGEVWNSHPAGGGDTLFVGVADGSSSYGGIIMGDGSQAFDNPNGGVLSLTKQGTGTFTVTGGANIYSGATTVNNGTLRIGGGNNRLPVGSSLVVNGGAATGGTFDLNSRNQTVAGLSGGGGAVPGVVTNRATGTGTLTVNSGGGSQFDGVLQNGGAAKILALTKSGGGDLTLAGTAANTFTGLTILDNGTLNLSKPAGVAAISGPVQMGAFNANQPTLRVTADNQFGSGAVLTFVNNVGAFPRFDLQGTQQTVAGLQNTTGAGVIQNERFNGGFTAQDATLTISNSANFSFNGYVRDEDDGGNTYKLNLAKTGTGTQTLAGNNITYTGTTTVSNGTLRLDTARSFNSPITLPGGGTLGLRTADTLVDNWTLVAPVTGTGTIVKDGVGWFHFRGAAPANFEGNIVINQGRLGNGYNTTVWTNSKASVEIAAGAELDLRTDDIILDKLTGSGDVVNTYYFGENNTLTVGVNNGSSQFDGIIRGTLDGNNNASVNAGQNSLLKVGTGTFITTGAHTYTGTTGVTGGVLQVGAGGGGNLGTGTVTITAPGALVFSSAGVAPTLANGVHGGGTLTQNGPGTQTLAGTGVDYIGATTVNGGTLKLQDARNFISPTTVNIGGTLEFNSSFPLATKWNYFGTLSGSGVINKTGPGVFGVPGNVNFAGTINVLEGRWMNDNTTSNWAGSTADVSVSAGAFFDLRANAINVDKLTGLGEVCNSHSANGQTQTLTVGVANGSSTFAGTILDKGSVILDDPTPSYVQLTKTGTGTFTLTGANAYSGITTISNGTLQIGNGGATGNLGTGAVVDNAALVFDRSNTITVGNVIGGTGSLTKNGAGKLVLTSQNTYGGPTTIAAGTLQLGAGQPLALVNSSAIWLDATDGATINTGGGGVLSWTNKGTLGALGDAAAAAGQEPTFVASEAAMNGQSVIHFASTGGGAPFDRLTNAQDFTGGNVTVMYAGRLSGGNDLRLLSSTGNNWLLGTWGGNSESAYFTNGFLSNAVAANTAAHVYTGTIATGGAASFYVNGALRGTGGGAQGPNGLSLGGGYFLNTNIENSNGDIGEMFVFSSVLSIEDRHAVESYLARKWQGLGNTNILPTAGAVSLTGAGAALDVNGVTQTIGALSGVAGTSIDLNGGSLTAGGATNTSYAGAISDTLATGVFTKGGSGALTLTGALTMTTLTAANGTLNIHSAVGTGTSTINANATVNIYASQTLAALNIAAGGEVTFGDGLPFIGGPGKAPAFGGAAVVPEPGSLVSLALGLSMLLARRRRPAGK